MNPWLLLAVAGLLETGWALGLKYTEGFTRPIPSVLTVAGALASFYLLSIAMKTIPVGPPMRSGSGSVPRAPRSWR